MAARSLRIDALRGLAVCGIAFVNVWGFVNGTALHRYAGSDALALADQLAVLLVSALAEQKFYPIFAFLFGAGFALQTGRRRAPGPVLDAIGARYRRRLQWLLACGVLHGSLLWFGDILTAYALTGFWLAGKAGRPLRELLASLRRIVILNVVIYVLYGGVVVASLATASADEIAATLADAARLRLVYTEGGWGEIALARLADYGANVVGLLVFMPRLALLFLLGVLAVRLGWLTHPQRHRALWRAILFGALAIGVPLNAWWAGMSVQVMLTPYASTFGHTMAALVVDLAGPCLGAAYVACFMLVRERLVAALAPLGKMALTNYLAQSLVLMLLLQGAGLGLGALLSRFELLALVAVLLLCQLLWCRWWLSRHPLGPMEALWRKLSHK